MHKEIPRWLSDLSHQVMILVDDLKQLGQDERRLQDLEEYFTALDHLNFASNDLDYLVNFAKQDNEREANR